MNLTPFARGVIVILTAIFLFDVMAAIIKHLGDGYPVQQIALYRNIFGLIPSVLVLFYSRSWHESGRPVRIRQWRLALARGGLVACAQFCFYLSLTRLEFATASTLAFAGPLFVTALSVPVLGHRVGLVRWLAVLIGFAGIIMVMRPTGGDFSLYALLPVGAALGYASTSVTARLFDDEVPTATINLYSLVGSTTGAAAIVIATGGYVEVGPASDWFWLIAMGTAGGLAVFSLISAYRLTEPSNLSPFEYFGIPFSFVLGWVFFAEAPFSRLLPGVFFIIGGGLLIVLRERMRNAQPGARS